MSFLSGALDVLVRVAVCLAALFEAVLLLLLVLIAFVVWRLLRTVRTEFPPVVGSVKKTLTTVEGTADFMTTTAAMPLIRVVSLIFAVTRFVQVLLGQGGRRGEGST